jgi:hypothetical protein
MSMNRSSLHLAPRRSTPSPLLCARLLGEHIRAARLRDGRPLEELAPGAGLTVAQWEGIEAGQAPYAWECICLMAAVLNLGRSWTPYLAQLWSGANPLVTSGQ